MIESTELPGTSTDDINTSTIVQQQQRSCWVCFATEDEEPTLKWLSPCECRGSTKWVHELCLQRWIDEKQKGDVLAAVFCGQCKCLYSMVLPRASRLVQLLERVDASITRLCALSATGAIVVSIYWTFTTYGAICIMQLCGFEHAIVCFEQTRPIYLLIGLPTIPIALITIGRFDNIEQYLAHRIDRWLNGQIDDIESGRRAFAFAGERNADGGGGGGAVVNDGGNVQLPHPNTLKSATRRLISALAIPTFASLTGRILCSKYILGMNASRMSTWKKAIIGYSVYFTIKTSIGIYYRYQQTRRRHCRVILEHGTMPDANHVPIEHTNRRQNDDDLFEDDADFADGPVGDDDEEEYYSNPDTEDELVEETNS